MDVLLSSGSSPRYRDDIIRALAMLAGTRLQFRYALRYLDADVATAVSSSPFEARDALIAYIDQSDPGKDIELIPCRFVRIRTVEVLGSQVSVHLELRSWCKFVDPNAFTQSLRIQNSGVPAWTDGKATGKYWLSAPSIASVSPSAELVDWENVVKELSARRDFAEEPFFYTITGIYEVGTRTPLVPADNTFTLNADTSYEVKMYHFQPVATRSGTLRLTSENKNIIFRVRSDVGIDSRYDVKRVRFTTSEAFEDIAGVIGVYRIPANTSRPPILDFDLEMLVRGDKVARFLTVLVLWVTLTVPATIAVMAGAAADANRVALLGLSAIASLIAAYAAVFHIRNPLG